MSESAPRRWNTAIVWALLLAIGAMLANVAFFARPPLQGALPWLSLVLALAALIALFPGLWRTFAQSHLYRGKVLTIVLAVVALSLSALNVFAFVQARSLPGSAAAPQVGQPAPDFTLADSSGRSVSLNDLFAAEPNGAAPKAVLLIFYRGYW